MQNSQQQQSSSKPSKPKTVNKNYKGHKFVARMEKLAMGAAAIDTEMVGIFGTSNPIPRREQPKVGRSSTLPSAKPKPKVERRQQTNSMSGINKAVKSPKNSSIDEEDHQHGPILKIPTYRDRSNLSPYSRVSTPGQSRGTSPFMANNQAGFSPSPTPQQFLFPPQQNQLTRQNSEQHFQQDFLHQNWLTTNSNAYYNQLNHSSGSLMSPACTTASNSPYGSNSQLVGFNYPDSLTTQPFMEKRHSFGYQSSDSYSPSDQFSQLHLNGSLTKHEENLLDQSLSRHYSLDSNGSGPDALRSPPPLIQINGQEGGGDSFSKIEWEIIRELMENEGFLGESSEL